ncbi:3-deoxy-D-manno-octulosonic acid transferase [Thiosulfativibrio zosterae]|uniref:3-deoxy-D-manno-octulosonic acid transferase n=1 Tax=Thiosulfativibrio zosterae TaxID=2675053 RepID=A0A6F8PL61_9GAMM|nr:3-deoxy-D-manno-octulosonic acid transferase [Thiosulfativibrio zosterae]BBP42839.1 3-deoxy-D-manno-octulosonic acid transferase [Thiosulfativibrio zosterae]
MNLLTYRFLLTLAKPLIAYSGWKRCQKYQDIETPIQHCFAARFGRNPSTFQKGGIWIHAVSVGETRSIFPLLSNLHQDYPELSLTVTNGSTQGALQALKFSPVPIQHQMIPYDFPNSVNRFLDQLQPKLVLMVETEIWPNLYQACHERKIPIVLINARLKETSFDAYRKWGGQMLRDALNQTTFIAAQFPADAQRFAKLGALPEKIKTLGNLKFDIEIQPGLVKIGQEFTQKNALAERFIWVAASTHENEETLILQAHQVLLQRIPTALLILVPRHANRFAEVQKICEASPLRTQTRSQLQHTQTTLSASTQVLLGDSVGELMLWFSVSQVAFIGGSLVPFGGHNILEPAALNKPVLSGPWFQNLQSLFEPFITAEAIQICETPEHLASTLIEFAQTPEKQKAAGEAAYNCFAQQTGALKRLMNELRSLLD